MGVWLILLMGGRVSLKSRLLVKEAWNASSLKGMLPLVRRVLAITFFFEGIGAILGYVVFSQDYPWAEALKISIFHSVSAFNNAGLDLLGNMQSLMPYRGNAYLTILTAGLIIAGGLGFLVFMDIERKERPCRWTLHTKAVVGTTAVLITGGTTGFSTISIGTLGGAGLFFLCILMFIGASPGFPYNGLSGDYGAEHV